MSEVATTQWSMYGTNKCVRVCAVHWSEFMHTRKLYMCVSVLWMHEWRSILWPLCVTHSYSKCFHVGASKAKPSNVVSRVLRLDSKGLPVLPASGPWVKEQPKIQPSGCYCKTTNTWLAWIIFFLNLALGLLVSFPQTTNVKLLTHSSDSSNNVVMMMMPNRHVMALMEGS